MKNPKNMIFAFVLLALSTAGVYAQPQQSRRSNDRQVGLVLQRLERSAVRFHNSLSLAIAEGRNDGMRPPNDINSYEPDFANAVAQFRTQLNRRRAGSADAENVLQKASLVNRFMSRNRLNTQVENHWQAVRNDLNALANVYGISWDWNRQGSPRANSNAWSRLSHSELDQLIQRIENGGETFRTSLTDAFGESRYDRTRGEANMNEAVRGFKNATDQLRNQFDGGQPVGEYVERLIARATPIDTYLRSNQLTSRTQNDWSTLRSDLNRLATAHGIAQSTTINSSEPALGNTGASNGEFIVRDGETVVAVLNNDLTTKDTKLGDRFTMTVRQPGQFEGAVIEGSVGRVDAGGRLSGRSGMSLNFDTILLRNGQTYRFAGALGSVRKMNGETIQVDNEGSAQGNNQTTQTIQRAGIGTAVGAIIGAIAGGGKGAVIGGVIGAAGGAGSVYVLGKDDLELQSGTELTIVAAAPR